MKIRLEHANMTVSDLDAAVRFVTTAFPEFRIRGGGKLFDGHRRWVHVGNDDTYLALVEADPDTTPAGSAYDGSIRTNHLGYEVTDVEALRQRMLGAGYRESTTPNDHPARRRVYFLDGEGNDWEFVEYASDEPGRRNDYSDAA